MVDEQLKTPEINKWCGLLCDYRTENYEDFKALTRKIELFEDNFSTEPIYL